MALKPNSNNVPNTASMLDGELVDLSAVDYVPAFPTRQITISVGGTFKFDSAAGTVGVAITLPAGVFPISVTKIYKTGTAAIGIAAWV